MLWRGSLWWKWAEAGWATEGKKSESIGKPTYSSGLIVAYLYRGTKVYSTEAPKAKILQNMTSIQLLSKLLQENLSRKLRVTLYPITSKKQQIFFTFRQKPLISGNWAVVSLGARAHQISCLAKKIAFLLPLLTWAAGAFHRKPFKTMQPVQGQKNPISLDHSEQK